MKAEKYLFKKWHFALILLAGTVVRFMYEYWSRAWLAAPHQLAWWLGLDEMDELLFGSGCGLSAEILKDRGDQAAIEKFINIIREWPGNYQPIMINGIYYSFRKASRLC